MSNLSAKHVLFWFMAYVNKNIKHIMYSIWIIWIKINMAQIFYK